MITVTVTENNWGTGRHSDIKAVLTSAAAQITRHLRGDVEAAIDVAHWKKETQRHGAVPRANELHDLAERKRQALGEIQLSVRT